MFKVGIKNFQSIAGIEFEVDGLTTLVGKSNIGKSAVIRAIKGLLQNAEGDYFVREGESYAEVEVECPELHAIWRKGGAKNDYEFPREQDAEGNNKELRKVGRGVPSDIPDAGFREIEVGRDTLNVQVADQFQPVFLLDQTGPTAAEVLCDVGRLSDIQEALKRSESDRRRSEDRLRVRTDDLQEVDAALGVYDGLEDAMRQVEEARSFYDDVRRLEREVERIEQLAEQADECLEVVDHLSGVDDVEIPEWDGDEDLAQLRRFDKLSELHDEAAPAVDRLSGVDDVEIPEWDGDEDLKRLIRLDKLVVLQGEVEGTLDRFEGLDDVEIPQEEFDEDLRKIRRIEKACKVRDGLAAEIRRYQKVAEVDVPDDEVERVWHEYSELLVMDEEFASLAGTIRSLRDEVSEIEADIEEHKDRIQQVFVEVGACPTCEREVSA